MLNGERVPDPSILNLKFQIIIDSKNILLGIKPAGGKMRAIITELDAKETNLYKSVDDAILKIGWMVVPSFYQVN